MQSRGGGERRKGEVRGGGGRRRKGEMWKRELSKGVSGEIAGEIVMSMGYGQKGKERMQENGL